MLALRAQINTEQVMRIGANTNYFEDYVLSIQYFNQVISVNPRLAKPYFYRAIAKLNLDDFPGAEEDASLAIERNPFIVDAYEVRGVARQNQGKNREAIKDYNKVLEMHPDTRSVLFNKAMAQCRSRTMQEPTPLSPLLSENIRAMRGLSRPRTSQTRNKGHHWSEKRH